MIGNNTIELNQATMCAALQHYFDTVLFAPGMAPKVSKVRGEVVNNHTGVFEVETEEKQPDATTPPRGQR